jgi:hypothetical protein
MRSLGLLLELDDRIDEMRGKIHVQHERIMQMELEGRDPSDACDILADLERSLRDTIRQRDQISRDVEQKRRWAHANARTVR